MIKNAELVARELAKTSAYDGKHEEYIVSLKPFINEQDYLMIKLYLDIFYSRWIHDLYIEERIKISSKIYEIMSVNNSSYKKSKEQAICELYKHLYDGDKSYWNINDKTESSSGIQCTSCKSYCNTAKHRFCPNCGKKKENELLVQGIPLEFYNEQIKEWTRWTMK